MLDEVDEDYGEKEWQFVLLIFFMQICHQHTFSRKIEFMIQIGKGKQIPASWDEKKI